eukprot:174117-Prymnesium_polylepis.1
MARGGRGSGQGVGFQRSGNGLAPHLGPLARGRVDRRDRHAEVVAARPERARRGGERGAGQQREGGRPPGGLRGARVVAHRDARREPVVRDADGQQVLRALGHRVEQRLLVVDHRLLLRQRARRRALVVVHLLQARVVERRHRRAHGRLVGGAEGGVGGRARRRRRDRVGVCAPRVVGDGELLLLLELQLQPGA